MAAKVLSSEMKTLRLAVTIRSPRRHSSLPARAVKLPWRQWSKPIRRHAYAVVATVLAANSMVNLSMTWVAGVLVSSKIAEV